MQNIKYLVAMITVKGFAAVSSLWQSIRSFPKVVKRNKFNIVFVLAWSIVITVPVIKVYLDYAALNRAELEYFTARGGAAPPFEQYKGPGLMPLDFVVILLASVACGAKLCDIGKVFYGSISALILSCSVASAYFANFIWNDLGWGRLLSAGGGDWTHVAYWGFLNAFREMFPLVFVLPFAGAMIGAILRTAIGNLT